MGYWAGVYCFALQEGRALSAIMTGEEGKLPTEDPDVLLSKYDMVNCASLLRPL